jgi:hypothetical protein
MRSFLTGRLRRSAGAQLILAQPGPYPCSDGLQGRRIGSPAPAEAGGDGAACRPRGAVNERAGLMFAGSAGSSSRRMPWLKDFVTIRTLVWSVKDHPLDPSLLQARKQKAVAPTSKPPRLSPAELGGPSACTARPFA